MQVSAGLGILDDFFIRRDNVLAHAALELALHLRYGGERAYQLHLKYALALLCGKSYTPCCL